MTEPELRDIMIGFKKGQWHDWQVNEYSIGIWKSLFGEWEVNDLKRAVMAHIRSPKCQSGKPVPEHILRLKPQKEVETVKSEKPLNPMTKEQMREIRLNHPLWRKDGNETVKDSVEEQIRQLVSEDSQRT